MTAHEIASKFRRALRNKTGASFTHEQLVWMARHGLLEVIAKAEIAELLAGLVDEVKDGT